MKTDMQRKSGGIDKLARDSSINATGTGVMVKDGAATPTGQPDRIAEKRAVDKLRVGP